MPEYYPSMLKTIDPIHRIWLEASCFWIMFSVRPLTSRELATAVAFHEHAEDATHLLDSCTSWDIVRDINRFAGPLVKLVDGKVEAIHKKVKRYVASEQRGESFVHRILLSKCITYITLVYSSIRTKEQRSDQNSASIPDTLHCGFLNYACVNWPKHFTMAKLDHAESSTLDKIWEFLQNPDLVAFWAKEFLRYHPDSLDEALFRSPLVIACVLGLVCLVPDLLASADAENEDWTGKASREAFFLAAEGGLVQLMDLFGDGWINEEDAEGYSPLLRAAKKGRADAENLVTHGTPANTCNKLGYSPIKYAAEGGFDDLVRLLNEEYAVHLDDMEAHGTTTALHLAAQYWHSSTCGILVGKGGNIEALDAECETPVSLAVRSGSVPTVKELLRNQPDTVSPDSDSEESTADDEQKQPGGTASHLLHLAAQLGNFSMAELLLGYKKYANRPAYRATFNETAYSGHLEIIRLLLENRQLTDRDLVHVDGSTALHWASQNGHCDIIQLLLSKGLVDVNMPDAAGKKALHWAAAEGHVAVIRILLNEGAGADLQSTCGDCAIHAASANGHVDVAEALAGNMRDILITGSEGTALTLAVVNQHSSVVKLLLPYARRQVIRAVENGDVVTLDMLLRHADEMNPVYDFPLWEAAAAGRNAEQMLRLLLAMGADVRARNSNNETVFFHVARRGLTEACRVLLEYSDGAGINDKSVDQITPFYLACYHQREQLVRILLPHTDVNMRCREGCTPLHAAAANAEITRLLLSAGADVNIRCDNQATPVVFAAEQGSTECVRLLLLAGADGTAVNEFGMTALHYAAQNGHVECVRLLIEHGADLNRKKANGAAPLHMVVRNGHEGTVT
ncbi:ankyrin 2,3/unc44, partial [Metarhizium majus ARSEF 297]